MDPVRTELMKNRFTAIVEEASTIAYRTAHTTFVKQTQDYQCAVATASGEIFAYPRQSGVSVFVGISLRAAIDEIGIETLEPGDIVITNDPFASDGLCSHTPDIHLIKPVFAGGEIIAFAWAFIHASDIGGAVPGSISAASTEVFQEGIRMRPVRLYRAGTLNRELLDLLRDNCRIPDDVWGDLQAMLAALTSLDRRLTELVAKLGKAEVLSGMAEVLDLAEAKARSVISSIPDGTYSFGDYVEGLRSDDLTFVHVAMTVAGDTMTLDFSGSDPQTQSSINFVSGSRTHPFLTQAINFYILTKEPTTPINGGLVRPLRTIAPKGTVMNAEFPAASGNRWVTVVRIYDAVLGCLNQALATGLAASGPGQSAVVAVTARDPLSGRMRVNVINPFCGGGGGRVGADGVDGVDGPQASLKNTPVEVIEAETAVRIRQYQLVPDTFGAGKWRGGAAIVMEIENTALEAVMAVRGLNRAQFCAWGAFSGDPGVPGVVTLNPGRDDEQQIHRLNILALKRGDVVRMVTPTGGGFGDPIEREAEKVATDVRGGLLSAAKAERDYGVVIDADGVNREATAHSRTALAARRKGSPRVAFCPARSAHEAIWALDVRAYLARKVLPEDALTRHHLLALVHDRLTARGGKVDRAAVDATISEARGIIATDAPAPDGAVVEA